MDLISFDLILLVWLLSLILQNFGSDLFTSYCYYIMRSAPDAYLWAGCLERTNNSGEKYAIIG